MDSILVKTLIMFLLSFVIAMIVAFVIQWIRNLLTSVRINSFFDEKSKIIIRRARKIHKIHSTNIHVLADHEEFESQQNIFDFYHGINEEYEEPEDFHGILKPIIRRKRSNRKHKILKK